MRWFRHRSLHWCNSDLMKKCQYLYSSDSARSSWFCPVTAALTQQHQAKCVNNRYGHWMNSVTAAPGISSRGIKCQLAYIWIDSTKIAAQYFLNVMKIVGTSTTVLRVKVGIWLLYFHRVLRRQRWAFHMLILNCVFMTRSDILPRLAHLILRESLSTSFIPLPQTRFGRLILKEGRIQCSAIRQSHLPTQSPFPTTQLLPLIYLPSVLVKELHPIVWPFFAHL